MKAVTTFGIAIGIFLLPVGLSASEEQKDIPKEAREAMQYMIGDWEIEGHENNQPMKGHVTHRWAPGNHCLTWDMVLTSPKGTFQGTAVIAWDRTRRQLVERDFWSDGSANAYWYTVGRGRWSGESLQVGPDGAATKGKIAQENLGPAEFVWKHFDSVGPAGKPGSVSELRFRKVNALTYEHFLEYGEAMVGDWGANVLLTGGFPESGKKGDTVPGRFTITWTFDRKAFVGQGRIGDVAYHWMYLWDPGSQRILLTGVDSHGGFSQARIVKAGNAWIAHQETTLADGKRRTNKDTMTIEDGGKTHIHVGSDIVFDGVTQPDYRDMWRRVKK